MQGTCCGTSIPASLYRHYALVDDQRIARVVVSTIHHYRVGAATDNISLSPTATAQAGRFLGLAFFIPRRLSRGFRGTCTTKGTFSRGKRLDQLRRRQVAKNLCQFRELRDIGRETKTLLESRARHRQTRICRLTPYRTASRNASMQQAIVLAVPEPMSCVFALRICPIRMARNW